MAIKAVFGRNLRALCKARGGSINAICRAIGIGRTQMDRYLNGDHLPNELNLKKISAFFEVEDTALFALGPPSPTAEQLESSLDPACRSAIDGLLSSGPSALAEGNYYTFFPLVLNPEQVILSLILVRRRGRKTVFRRLTRFSAGPAPSQDQGDHEGIVVDRFDAHYFVGVNRISAREPSLALLRWLPVGEALLGGRALVFNETAPTALPIAMRAAPPDASLRTVRRQSGIIDLNSPLVGSQVAQFLRRPYL